MSFTVGSPGCCLLQGPILLLSDKAGLLFSLCNPLFVGETRPKPPSVPPRLPESPDITPSSILFPQQVVAAPGLSTFPSNTFSTRQRLFSALTASFLEKRRYISLIPSPLHSLSSHARLFSLIPRSRSLRQPTLLPLLLHPSPPLHRSCAVAFELKCCKSVIRI